MKIVVLGGSGYIGSHVVEQLLLSGAKPICVVRPSANLSFLRSIGADCRPSDFSDAALSALLQGVDVVINCVARPELHQHPDAHRAVDVELTVRIFRAAEKSGVGRFLQLSTVQVYGFRRPPVPVNEEYPCGGDYAFNRMAMEREASLRQLAHNSRTALVLLRPANIIGARDPNFGKIIALHRAGFFPMIGQGARFSAVDARDVGRAMVFLSEAEKLQHDCYLLKGFDTSWQQVKETLDELSGRRAVSLRLPRVVMMGFGRLCEALYPYGANPPLTRFAVEVMATDTLFDDARLRREGFTTKYGVGDALGGAAVCNKKAEN
jgi:dihydroflavonol-4-reductase